jgi:hypothetical protein
VGIVPDGGFNLLALMFPAAERFASFVIFVTLVAAVITGFGKKLSVVPLGAICLMAIASATIFDNDASQFYRTMAIGWAFAALVCVACAVAGLIRKGLLPIRLLRFTSWLLLADMSTILGLMFLRRDAVANPAAFASPEYALQVATNWQSNLQAALWVLLMAMIGLIIWAFFATVKAQNNLPPINRSKPTNNPATAGGE